MIEKSIFGGIDGSINNDMYPDVDEGGERVIKEKVIGIYKPAEELNYNNRKIIYQVVEISKNEGFIIIPGYRVSENYQKEIGREFEFGNGIKEGIKTSYNSDKTTCCDVELVNERDKPKIRKLLSEISKFYVNFWRE
jgi:hypothetical protein